MGGIAVGCAPNGAETDAFSGTPTPQGSLPSHITSSCFRDCELSLQSSLHLSIALLVRYRSHAGNQPCAEYTARFELHSQVALLAGTRRVTAGARVNGAALSQHRNGAVTLCLSSIPGNFGSHRPQKHRGASTPQHPALPPREAVPDGVLYGLGHARVIPLHSQLLGISSSLSLPPPTDMLKLGGSLCEPSGQLRKGPPWLFFFHRCFLTVEESPRNPSPKGKTFVLTLQGRHPPLCWDFSLFFFSSQRIPQQGGAPPDPRNARGRFAGASRVQFFLTGSQEARSLRGTPTNSG